VQRFQARVMMMVTLSKLGGFNLPLMVISNSHTFTKFQRNHIVCQLLLEIFAAKIFVNIIVGCGSLLQVQSSNIQTTW
jgi:hypothetical protein